MMDAFGVLVKNRCQLTKPPQSSGGFTLIELLVAVVMSVLVLTPLFSFMINILTTERREQAKIATEQELQATVDYITRDLEQAVYIYDKAALTRDNSTSPPGIRDQIPPNSGTVNGCTPTNCTPVLAFWKREVYENAFQFDNKNCVDLALCNDAFAYSLVVYYRTTDDPASIWSNTKRIARFEINGGVLDPTVPDPPGGYFIPPSPGYDPFDLSIAGTLDEKLNQWEKDSVAYNASALVLVDHIDEFQAEVDTTTNTAQVTIRANALSRLQLQSEDISFTPERTSFFPSTTILVQGLGTLN